MTRTFDFGKIDFYNSGMKSNRVTVTASFVFKKGKKCFSAFADVYNASDTDIIHGGQCLDDLAKHMTDRTFFELYRLWKLYHLNDMHPECEHQRSLGWPELAEKQIKANGRTQLAGWVRESVHPDGLLCKPCPVCGYKYGTQWMYMPIPLADEARIRKLIETGKC